MNIGLEAINFQVKSRLARELTAYFNKIIELTKTNDNFSFKNISNTLAKDKKLNDELAGIIKNNTGIQMSGIFYSSTPDSGFAMLPVIREGKDVFIRRIVMNQATGLGNFKSAYLKAKTLRDLEKLSEILNKETGKIDTFKFGNYPISMMLYMCPYTSYYLQQSFTSTVEPLTAEEISAIVMHEIGHFITTVELAADNYRRLQLSRDAFDSFYSNASIDDKVTIIEQALANPELQQNATYKQVATELIEAYKLKKNDEEKFVKLVDVVLIPTILVRTCFNLIINILFSPLSGTVTHLNNNLRFDQGEVKISDFSAMSDDFKEIERIADEYVSRHGYGSYNASALNKLFKIDKYIDIKTDYGVCPSMLSANLYSIFIALGGKNNDSYLYDSLIPRIKYSLRQNIKALKYFNMSQLHMDLYIKDYERTVKVLDDVGVNKKVTLALENVWAIFRHIASVPDFVSWMSSGNIDSQYNNLLSKIEGLDGNNLYYRAAKLKQILNKK